MKVLDKIKSMDVSEFAEWLDKNCMHDNSPWIKWFDSTYCKKCEPEIIRDLDNGKDIKCAYCELCNRCKFFKEMNGVPEIKQMINMWLESEI